RHASKPFPLIIGDRALLSLVVSEIGPLEEKIMDAFWPGPLTIVFKAREGLSRYIVDERSTVAVRMPGRSFALDLAERIRIPITATSANRTEMHPAKSGREVIQYFPEGIDFLIDGGESTAETPSTILEVRAGKVRLLREGVVPLSGIESVL
ncbi:MAG: L-threonylcarbamoyladenylate synthase, partial [bacterium]